MRQWQQITECWCMRLQVELAWWQSPTAHGWVREWDTHGGRSPSYTTRATAMCAAWPALGTTDHIFDEQTELQGYLACCHSLVATPAYLWDNLALSTCDTCDAGIDTRENPAAREGDMRDEDGTRVTLPTISCR